MTSRCLHILWYVPLLFNEYRIMTVLKVDTYFTSIEVSPDRMGWDYVCC